MSKLNSSNAHDVQMRNNEELLEKELYSKILQNKNIVKHSTDAEEEEQDLNEHFLDCMLATKEISHGIEVDEPISSNIDHEALTESMNLLHAKLPNELNDLVLSMFQMSPEPTAGVIHATADLINQVALVNTHEEAVTLASNFFVKKILPVALIFDQNPDLQTNVKNNLLMKHKPVLQKTISLLSSNNTIVSNASNANNSDNTSNSSSNTSSSGYNARTDSQQLAQLEELVDLFLAGGIGSMLMAAYTVMLVTFLVLGEELQTMAKKQKASTDAQSAGNAFASLGFLKSYTFPFVLTSGDGNTSTNITNANDLMNAYYARDAKGNPIYDSSSKATSPDGKTTLPNPWSDSKTLDTNMSDMVQQLENTDPSITPYFTDPGQAPWNNKTGGNTPQQMDSSTPAWIAINAAFGTLFNGGQSAVMLNNQSSNANLTWKSLIQDPTTGAWILDTTAISNDVTVVSKGVSALSSANQVTQSLFTSLTTSEQQSMTAAMNYLSSLKSTVDSIFQRL